MPILVKTKGQGIDTLWGVLTALLRALAKLSVWSVGKRNPDGGFWRLRDSNIPSYCLSGQLALWRSSRCSAWCPLQLTVFTVDAFSLTPLYLSLFFSFFKKIL